MSIIRIESFGGEAPSVSGQALAGDAAQLNVNLYSGTREFRPLMEDKDTGVASAGAKTIYRAQRHAGGYNGVANETLNWRTSGKELSFVKGQVNDDATERTYVTTSDGSDVPRAFNISTAPTTATTAMRKLGVPAPAAVAAVIKEGKSFTSIEAPEAIKAIAKAVRDAIIECTIIPGDLIDKDPATAAQRQKGSRYTGYVASSGTGGYGAPGFTPARLVPRAGPKSNYSLWPTEDLAQYLPASYQDLHWRLHAVRTGSDMRGILGAQGVVDLGLAVGDYVVVSIDALPFCLVPEKPDPANPGKTLLEARLRAIKNPKDDTPLFDDAAITSMLQVLIDGSRMQTRAPDLLDKIDACTKTFSQVMLETKASSLTGSPAAAAPVAPAVPTTAQWRTVRLAAGVLSSGGSATVQRETDAWIAYRVAKADYDKDYAAYTAQQAGNLGPAPVRPVEPTVTRFGTEWIDDGTVVTSEGGG